MREKKKCGRKDADVIAIESSRIELGWPRLINNHTMKVQE